MQIMIWKFSRRQSINVSQTFYSRDACVPCICKVIASFFLFEFKNKLITVSPPLFTNYLYFSNVDISMENICEQLNIRVIICVTDNWELVKAISSLLSQLHAGHIVIHKS